MIPLFASGPPTKALIAASRKWIVDLQAHGVTLLLCANVLLGDNYRAYEFDTIRKVFIDSDLEVPQPNYDRLWASMTLIASTAFFWDARVFSSTVRCFAGEDIDPEALEPIPPVFLGWGVYEADVILSAYLDFDTGRAGDAIDGEPLEMIVASLYDAGFVQAPEGIEWAQPYLDAAMDSHVSGLRVRVRRAWDKLDKEALADTEFAEDEVGVQLARLAGCQLYYAAQGRELRSQLAELQTAGS